MKFKPGNILQHCPTKTKWIVLSTRNIENAMSPAYRLEIRAYCVYVGEHKRACKYWKVNEPDTFILTQQDLNPSDYVWEVESEV